MVCHPEWVLAQKRHFRENLCRNLVASIDSGPMLFLLRDVQMFVKHEFVFLPGRRVHRNPPSLSDFSASANYLRIQIIETLGCFGGGRSGGVVGEGDDV